MCFLVRRNATRLFNDNLLSCTCSIYCLHTACLRESFGLFCCGSWGHSYEMGTIRPSTQHQKLSKFRTMHDLYILPQQLQENTYPKPIVCTLKTRQGIRFPASPWQKIKRVNQNLCVWKKGQIINLCSKICLNLGLTTKTCHTNYNIHTLSKIVTVTYSVFK